MLAKHARNADGPEASMASVCIVVDEAPALYATTTMHRLRQASVTWKSTSGSV